MALEDDQKTSDKTKGKKMFSLTSALLLPAESQLFLSSSQREPARKTAADELGPQTPVMCPHQPDSRGAGEGAGEGEDSY